MIDVSHARTLARWLQRATVDELCLHADPLDSAWEGLLYDEQVTTGAYDHAADDDEARRHGLDLGLHRRWLHARRLQQEGRAWLVSGPWLSSEAVTPFVLDARRYASVASFYAALKLAEDDPRREAVARGDRVARRLRPAARGSLTYEGRAIAVGSAEHCALVARATAAKVHAHAEVWRALAATGRSLLFMGGRYGTGPQALGRAMPFALMVLRHRGR